MFFVLIYAGAPTAFKAIDEAAAREGWKMVLLLRLSPVFQFVLLNNGLGLTKIRFWPAIFASWVGMLPGTILYVYLGSIAKVATGETTTSQGSILENQAIRLQIISWQLHPIP